MLSLDIMPFTKLNSTRRLSHFLHEQDKRVQTLRNMLAVIIINSAQEQHIWTFPHPCTKTTICLFQLKLKKQQKRLLQQSLQIKKNQSNQGGGDAYGVTTAEDTFKNHIKLLLAHISGDWDVFQKMKTITQNKQNNDVLWAQL